jgi:hypothetical protein
MDANPFAQVPPEPEAVVALVLDQLKRDCDDGRCPPGESVDRLVEAAVMELWDAPVKTFIPVLALRRARETLLAEHPGASTEAAGDRVVAWAPRRPRREPGADVLEVDDGDTLRV